MTGLYGAGRPVLVLAPHPDDETFGCGGAIRLFTEGNGKADVAFVTRGECGGEMFEDLSDEKKHSIGETRALEAAEACRILGVDRQWFLSGRDGAVAQSPSVLAEIVQLLRHTAYGRVFCPWSQDSHGDHMATFQWLKRSLAQTRYDCDVWLYEVWRPLVPNLILPLGSAMDVKLAAMRAHQSQLKCMNYVEGFTGLAAYRGLTAPPAKFAEAFVVTSSAEIVAGHHG